MPATTSPSVVRASSAVFGDSGDDWMEGGDMADLLIGDSSTLFFDDHNIPGHDVTIGQGGDDDYDTEGGDDIMVGGPGVEKNAGAAGFDWLIGLNDPQAQFADLNLRDPPRGPAGHRGPRPLQRGRGTVGLEPQRPTVRRRRCSGSDRRRRIHRLRRARPGRP